MHKFPFVVPLLLLGLCAWNQIPPAAAQEAVTVTSAPMSVSQLEADPAGWTDLLPDAALHGWKRVAYPGKPLKDTNPWSVDPESHLLVCDGTKTVEMFLTEQEFGDGVFHVEWRLRKVEGKQGYNGGVFVRNSADGTVWHQAQVGDRKDIGYFFGNTSKDGKVVPFHIDDKVPPRGNPPGEWNTYEITCQGPNVNLWINGGVTATWTDCQVTRGLVGLEAEGWVVEFRSVKFKAAP